jgi:hypothetical protein
MAISTPSTVRVTTTRRTAALIAALAIAPSTTHSQSRPSSTPSVAGESASPVLSLLATARDPRTRFQAALTLGRLRPPGAREALERALDDSDATVRASAAESLRTIGDAAAIPALRARRSDPDPTVRSTVARALALLEGNTAAASSASASPLGAQSPNWSTARFVLRPGALANRADQRTHIVDALRDALAQELARLDDVAFSVGALPPEAERRVRSGRLRVFTIDGSVQQLRRWSVASTLSVRAEVSLVLVAVPARSIVGSMSGAATAQNTTSPGQTTDALARDLEQRALHGAVRGAVANLRASLSGRS